MSARIRRPSLVGSLLWIGLGILFLFRNFGIGPEFWHILGRYWPVLLILLGLGKLVDYYVHKDAFAIRLREIAALLLVLAIGTALTRVSESNLSQAIRDMPIALGGDSIRPGEWLENSYSYTEQATYAAPVESSIRVENAYGSVAISPGEDHEVRVLLKKVVYSEDESRARQLADQLRLHSGREPGEGNPTLFTISTNREKLALKGSRFETHMEISVPKNSSVVVANKFGEIRMVGLNGRMELTTTHAPIEVRDCTGEFMVSNRYADSRLLNLRGKVSVEARGTVSLEKIVGNVNVRNEFSPVEISDVDGTVTVSNTESNIRIESVTSPVVIAARGCQVRVQNLQSTLQLTTSHRDVNVSDVRSNVSLNTQYGSIALKKIAGNVDIQTNSDKIGADDIGGYLMVKGQRSGVRADGVFGSVTVETTLKPVVVTNFKGDCRINNEYGDIRLSTGEPLKGNIAVKNHSAPIEIYIPDGASLEVDALAKNGRVNSEYPGLQAERGAGEVLKAKLKGGGPKVVLETDHDDINIKPMRHRP